MATNVSRLIGTLFLFVMCASASARPQAPRDLSLALERLQASGIGILMPDPAIPYRTRQVIPLTPGFPPEFREGFVAVDVGGVLTYPVTVRTDDTTGEMRYFNASEEVFWIEYPTGVFSADWIANLRGADPSDPLYLPSHVEFCFTFVEEQDTGAYHGVRSAQRFAATLARQPQKPMSPSRTFSSPIFITDFRTGTNAFEFTTEWSSPLLGNAFDLFHTSDLLYGRWGMLGRIPVDPSTNAVSFTVPFSIVPVGGNTPPEAEDDPVTIIVISPMDPGVTYTNVVSFCKPAPSPKGFFQLGTLLDSDGDGLTDAYERLVSLTDPNDPIDALIDSDGDGLPNSYELHYGTDPLVPDSDSIPRLIIKHNPSAPNEFATFRAAFAASVPYSIIEVKDGEYEASWVYFPPHPILLMSENWGKSRKAIIRATGKAHVQTAFRIPAADNRTIIRGLHLRMELSDTSSHRIGFWVGGQLPLPGYPGASPVFDGVVVELADATQSCAFYIQNAAPQPVVFMNCVIAPRYGVTKMARGVYAVDSPPLLFENCTFLSNPGNPYSFGLQLETTAANKGGASPVIPVSLVNCLWDAGFNTNAFLRAPFAKLEKCPQTAYSVSMRNCIIPFPIEDYPAYPASLSVESTNNLFTVPVSLAVNGHLRAPLPYTGAPSHFAPCYDFEGQPRNPLAPTIGADEFIPLPDGPPNPHGITAWDKIILHGLSPYIADYDSDGVDDLDEIMNGTSPFDTTHYCFTLSSVPHPRLAASAADVFAGLSTSASLSSVFASVPVEPDGSFAFGHTVIHTNASLRLALFRTNGNHTGFVSVPFRPTAYHNEIPPGHALFTQDSDNDGMPDWWEIFNGLNPFNAADALLDPDGDFLINLHEYWSNTNPFVPDTGITNSNPLAHIAYAIDSRIAGKDTNGTLTVFGDLDTYTNNAANGVFIRNPSCWVADIDLTCASPWQSYVYLPDPKHKQNNFAGTLISPRHVLFARHYDWLSEGTTMTFVDMNNQVVERILVAKRPHTNYFTFQNRIVYRDFTVGILNEDVPPSISFAKVLPDDYADYLRTGYGLPCVRFTQEENAWLGNISTLEAVDSHPVGGINYKASAATPPVGSPRRDFYGPIGINQNLKDGDSGNPMFIIVNDQPVLLTVWTYGASGTGTAIHKYKDDLNAMMSWLSNLVGAATNYQLTKIDLSGFTKLPP